MPEFGGMYSDAAVFPLYTAAPVTVTLLEVNAPIFWTKTGRIQVGIKNTVGTVTAGTITPYIRMLAADTVFTQVPTAAMSAIAATNLILAPVDLGAPCHFKLCITVALVGAGGGPSINLYVRDAHV